MQHSFSVTIREHYFQFQTGEGVFSRGHLDTGTQLLTENMILPEVGSLLDLGCGYGPIGIVAAKLRPNLKVILSDNDPKALRLARANARLNRVDNVDFKLGSIYAPVASMKFDAIITNPPLSAGFAILSQIIRGGPLHLNKEGMLQLVLRKGFDIYGRECEAAFGNVGVLARGSGYRVFESRVIKT